MVELDEVFPIGIGTFRLGKGNRETIYRPLVRSFEKGQNYMTLNMVYYGGTMDESILRFMRHVPREEVFYMFGVDAGMGENEPPVAQHIRSQVDDYLAQTGFDVLDGVQLHDYAHTSLPEVYRSLAELQDEGKVRCLGASNLGVQQLREIESVAKLDVYEGMYNFECRQNEIEGVFSRCSEQDVLVTCYQPLRRNLTARKDYPLLQELSKECGITQNQLILNWIIRRKGYYPLVKSCNIEHIDENVAALDYVLSDSVYDLMDAFVAREVDGARVDWAHDGDGILINRVPYLMGDYPTQPRKINL